MERISEIVKINSLLGSEVNLIEELFDKEKNALRMSNYMPTKGHREAFIKIIKGLYENSDKRAYILNGSYGTGKSNLLLMIANYLMNNSNSQEMTQFFNNYLEREEDENNYASENDIQKMKENISHLKGLRATDKPHFVALCKYDVSGDFTEILLRAIKEAFDRENISIDNLDSIYQEAIRKIEQWENAKSEASFYEQLILELEKTNRTVESFKNKLDSISSETLREFKSIYKRLTLSDFTYEKDNLTDIIKETIKSSSFKEKYSGFTIFFDEFGNILKNHRFDELVFQRFTEFCQNSLLDKIPVIFIATTHKSFETYAEYYDRDQFKKVSDRFIDVSLSTEGFEDIISAIIRPNKNSETWKSRVEKSKEFLELAKKTTILKLFEGLKGKKLEEKLIKNLYPMHPMATFALLGLSKEVSSNSRSVYSFFIRGGFKLYIEETDIENGDRLNFYTANKLIEYFKRDNFKSNNQDLRVALKDKVRNYESSKSEFEKFKRNEIIKDVRPYEEVMDTMLIYHLLEVSVTEENIYFGLNIKLESQREEIKKVIVNLVKYGVIYYKKTTESFEFKQSDLLDVDGIIAEYIRDNKTNNINIVDELKKLKENRNYSQIKSLFEKFNSKIEPLPKFFIDSQYQNDLIRVHDIESSSFLKLKSERIDKQNIFTYTSEGFFLYVLCENNKERERALRAAENSKDKNLIFAIPRSTQDIREFLLGILAIEKSEKLKNLKQQEVIMLDNAKKMYIDKIFLILGDLGKANNLDFFYLGEKIILEGGNKEKILITEILKKKYDENLPSIDIPLKQRRDDFNVENERSFKEFIERFITIKEPILYDVRVSGRADDRYFKILLDSQVLSIYETDETGKDRLNLSNSMNTYNCYPALKHILEKIEVENISIENLKHDLTQKYALGKYGMHFILAYIYRYFNGNISFITSQGTNQSISNYKDIEKISEIGKEIRKIKISEREKQFITTIYRLFKESGTLNQRENIEESFVTIKEWYNTLQKYQKIETIIDFKTSELFKKINNLTAEEFILSELNTLIGKEKDEILSEEETKILLDRISKFKSDSETSKEIIFKKLLKEVSKKFNIRSEEVYQFFYNYYNELPEFKKNSSFEKHSQESRKILFFLEEINRGEDYEELLLNYTGSYKEWSVDKTKSISEALYKGYNEMERLFLIDSPKIFFEGEYKRSNDVIYFGDDFKVIIENLDKNIYDTYYIITNDGKSVIESFGSLGIKIAKERDEISNLKDGDILSLINQQNSDDSTKKRSTELKIRFRNIQKQYEPILEKKMIKQEFIEKETSKSEINEKIVFGIIPQQKSDLKSSINGLINTVMSKSQIKKEDVREILEQLLSDYSRGK